MNNLRAANIEARRARILEATAHLIETEGLDGLSMRKLASHAGLSVTTLYNLFGSRTEILSALVHDLTDRIASMLDTEAPLDHPLDRARAIITVSIEYIGKHEKLCRPMFIALYQGLDNLPHDRFGMPERAAGMQQLAIEGAVEQGLLRAHPSADILSTQVYHGYEMAVLLWGRGLIGLEEFEARALYGLYIALLAAATDEQRPKFEKELRRLERILRKCRSNDRRHTKRSA